MGCGAPVHLDRKLRFNGARVIIFASEVLPNTSKFSPGILTRTARPLYKLHQPGSENVAVQSRMLSSNDIGYHEPTPRASPSVLP